MIKTYWQTTKLHCGAATYLVLAKKQIKGTLRTRHTSSSRFKPLFQIDVLLDVEWRLQNTSNIFIPGDNKGVRPSCQSPCAIWSKDIWHWSFSVRLVLPESLPAKQLSYIILFPYSVSYYISISHSFFQIMMSSSNTSSWKLINSVYVTTIANIFWAFQMVSNLSTSNRFLNTLSRLNRNRFCQSSLLHQSLFSLVHAYEEYGWYIYTLYIYIYV